MKKLFNNKWLLLALIIAIIAGRKLLTLKHFHIHDDLHIFRLNEYIECWRDGQIPCRWSNDLGKGYGYPVFIFYPPMMYFIPAIINLFGFSYIASFNIFSFLTFPLAAYGMYKLIASLTKNDKLSFLGSTLYTLYPYHASNIFIRGAYAENLAWALLPYIFWQFYELIINKKHSYKPAVFLTLIILTHNISSMLFYPITILWCLFLIIYSKKNIKNISNTLLMTAKNLVFPIFLSAFFLVPALIERTIVQSDSMIINYYSYLVHFVSVNQIFFSNFWGYGGSGPDLLDGMSFMLGKPYWITFILLAGFYIYKNRTNRKKLLHPVVLISLISAPIFIFMMHARSTPIWLLFTPLQYIQFPWRLLGVAGFFIILFISYSAKDLPKKLIKPFITILTILVISLSFSFFQPEKYDEYIDDDYITGQFSSEQKESHLYDYMPITVHRIPDKVASSPIYTSKDPIDSIKNIQWRSNYTELTITQESDNLITFSSIEYPDWQAHLDGELVAHQADPLTGFVTLSVPSGTHVIRIERQEPSHRIMGNIISLFSLAYLIFAIRSKDTRK